VALERRHQFVESAFSSTGTEANNHFYPCSLLPDPFTNGGTLVRTISWPKVALRCGAPGPNTPDAAFWGRAQFAWIAWYSVDGTVPPPSLISPYSANCVLRSSLTPAVYPDPVAPNAYQYLLTCAAEGIDSRRMVKPQDPVLTAKLITGFWVNDFAINPGAFPNLHILGSSNDYTIWEKRF
jgi:hypothetical protein